MTDSRRITVAFASFATLILVASSAPATSTDHHIKALCAHPINVADPCDFTFHLHHIAADSRQECQEKVTHQRQQCIDNNRLNGTVSKSSATDHVLEEIKEAAAALQLLLDDRYKRLNDSNRTELPMDKDVPADVREYCAAENETRFIIPSSLPIPQRNDNNDLRMEEIQRGCFTTLLSRNHYGTNDDQLDDSYHRKVTDFVTSRMRALSCAMTHLNYAHHHAGGHQCIKILNTASRIPRTESRWNGDKNPADFTLEIIQLLNSYDRFLNTTASYLRSR